MNGDTSHIKAIFSIIAAFLLILLIGLTAFLPEKKDGAKDYQKAQVFDVELMAE